MAVSVKHSSSAVYFPPGKDISAVWDLKIELRLVKRTCGLGEL
jgi:hypothetical protein